MHRSSCLYAIALLTACTVWLQSSFCQEDEAAPKKDPPAAAQPSAEAGDASGTATKAKKVDIEPLPVPPEKMVLNFRKASVREVLTQVARLNGLSVVLEADITGDITVISPKEVETDEAIKILNAALSFKGVTAVRSGEILKIVSLLAAPKSNVPVHTGNDPEAVEPGDHVITQIIPVQYAEAPQLQQDLAPLIPAHASLVANAGSNVLIYTDNATHVRRLLTILKALDSQIAEVADIRVFTLKHADATELANALRELFATDGQRRATSSRSRFFDTMRERYMQYRYGFSRSSSGRGSFPSSRSRSGRTGQSGGTPRPGEGAAAARKEVKVTVDVRTNSLIVVASKDNLAIIEQLVKELDADPTEVEGTMLYHCKNANAVNIANVLNDLFAEENQRSRTARTSAASSQRSSSRSVRNTSTSRSSSVRPSSSSGSRYGYRSSRPSTEGSGPGGLTGEVYAVPEEDRNAVLVITSPKNFEEIRRILEDLDRVPPQVLIQALFAEVTEERSEEWEPSATIFDNSKFIRELDQETGRTFQNIGTVQGRADFQLGQGFTFSVTNRKFEAMLRALNTIAKLNILSRPQVLVSDNQEASFFVGENTPFVQNTRTTPEGGTLNTIVYRDVGLTLRVTPHINPEGLVNMEIFPEISTRSESTVTISEDLNATVFPTRNSQTIVAVQDGSTVVIAGLIRDEVQDTESKVPILGSIPLLGRLFTRINKVKQKTELLIFVTPHVVTDNETMVKVSKGASERPDFKTTLPERLHDVIPDKK